MNAETLLAAVGLGACAVLLARMAIGTRRRARLDDVLRRRWRAVDGRVRGWLRQRRVAEKATREAQQAIERARRSPGRVDREGNVYRPRSFNDRSDDVPDGRQRRDH
jgi:hypothetical protein